LHAESTITAWKIIPNAQLAPHLLQQPIMAREGQITNLDGQRILAATCPAGRNDWDVPLFAPGNQQRFSRRTVDRVQNIVEPSFQNLGCIGFQKKAMNSMDLAVWIDRPHPPLQYLHLRLAQLAVQGVELPIDVADANVIQIDQRQATNAGTSQRLDGPRTNSAQANDTDMGLAYSPQASRAEQTPNTTKSSLELLLLVILHGSWLRLRGRVAK
jgi:hypothetical protein